MSNGKSGSRCVVILTAIPVEYQAIRDHLAAVREVVHPQGTIYQQGRFLAGEQVWTVGIVRIGLGNHVVAAEIERAITYFDPEVVLFVGVAGGLKDVALYDVVVGTKVYGYESGKIQKTKKQYRSAKMQGSRFFPRPDVGQSSYSLVQRAMIEAGKKAWLKRIRARDRGSRSTPRVFLGPIAAGEKVFASTDSAVFELLQSSYGDALAVDMESRGFLHGAHLSERIQALVIRGISDLIDNKTEVDAEGSQEIAARHASAFVFTLLANLNTVGSDRKTYETRLLTT